MDKDELPAMGLTWNTVERRRPPCHRSWQDGINDAVTEYRRVLEEEIIHNRRKGDLELEDGAVRYKPGSNDNPLCVFLIIF